MKELTPKEVVILGTAIGMELAKGKDCEEIRQLLFLFSQIYHTLSQLAK